MLCRPLPHTKVCLQGQGVPTVEIKERIAYIRGLLEGAEFSGGDDRGRAIWENLLGVCSQLADAVNLLEDEQADLGAYLEAVDADLSDLEEITDIPDYVIVECPHCGEEVCFEEEFLYDDHAQVACPDCGEEIKEATHDHELHEASTPGGVGAGTVVAPGPGQGMGQAPQGWNHREPQPHHTM